MKILSKIAAIILLSLNLNTLLAQSNRILIDENFDDWNNITEIYSDTNGDQLLGEIDFGKLWINNDDKYLFFKIEVGGEINLQDDNDINIYIDTDNNASTGISIAGIGAELNYNFGKKSGVVNISGNTYVITQVNIGIVSAPTISSNQFEIAFSLNSTVNELPIFSGDTIKIYFQDDGEGKDWLPNEDGGIQYTLTTTFDNSLPTYSIKKENEQHLRVLSYNIHKDDIFDPDLQDEYIRILQSIDPEIIAFQEIYLHSSQETADLIETILPSDMGETWYHSKVIDILPANQNPTDLIILSRYNIKETFRIEGFKIEGSIEDRANFAVLLDLRPKYNSDLLLINAHPPCCSWDTYRQIEIDNIMAFIRDAKENGGIITLEPNTPIIVTGDMNLVRLAQQQTTLLTGDIFYNNLFGDDFSPDWDGANFTDTKPYTTSVPMVFTWYNENSEFSPGRLDYMVYTKSVIEEVNSYVLFTKEMNADTLAKYDLQSNDVVVASDHLPLVVDFDMKNLTDVDQEQKSSFINYFRLEQNYPNPFNPTTTIKYSIPTSLNLLFTKGGNTRGLFITLKVFDLLGKEVATLISKKQATGNYKAVFDASALSSGIYYYTLTAGNFRATKKLILMK